MKKIFLLLLLIASTLSVSAQEQDWQIDVKGAADLAIQKKKPLMLFFTGSDWCGWCIRLQKEVFKTPEFTKWANENVVLVELDFPRRKPLPPELVRQNAELQQMFGVRGYPTVWLVTPTKINGQVNFERLGSTGYVAGGPQAWINSANLILKK